jgi:acyl carrier protein
MPTGPISPETSNQNKFEDEFGIEIDDETANKIRTLGDAVTTVTSKMG